MPKILSNHKNLLVLYEDNHLIAVNKRAGDIVQGDKTGDIPLSEIVKDYLKHKYNKPGKFTTLISFEWTLPLAEIRF